MTELESLSRGWDHLGAIAKTLGDLQGSRTAIHELIQNADDAPGATLMRFTVTDDVLEVWNDGEFERCTDVTTHECSWLAVGGHRCDFHSFRRMASGDKRNRPDTTGAFGVGFTAVYQLTDRPELLSNGEHWIIDETAPEERRVSRAALAASHIGTTFRLPWAIQPSTFRSEVRQEVVSPDYIASFLDELFDAIPRAMPFLKKLSRIEATDGERTRTFERRSINDRLVVSSSNGDEFHWFVLSGSFSDAAEELTVNHREVIEDARSSRVVMAFPLDHESPAGLLYATLPTEEASHLPILINADFYPASDRKRIRFDDAPESEWNRAAIRATAGVLAANLDRLPDAIGDQRLVRMIIAARELSTRLESERIEPCFGDFWTAIVAALRTTRVVPTEDGSYGTVQQVRLWSEEIELDSAPMLHELGIALVERNVKDEWYQLRSRDVGLQNLHLSHVTFALRFQGLTSRRVPDKLPGELATEAGLGRLWRLLDVLLEIRDRSNQESRDALLSCAVVPGWDSALWPIRDVHRADKESQDLFADAGIAATFLDFDRLGPVAPRLAGLVEAASLNRVLEWIEKAFEAKASASDFDPGRVLDWFHQRRATLADDERARVARLPVFPTAAGSKPLTGLALPGDFVDQLGLARVVVMEGIEEMRPFLHALGAERLTFATYCTDHVTEAVGSGDLSEEQRHRLLVLLATRLSEVRDDPAVRAALRPLELVPCIDDQWRGGDEVYLHGAVRDIVGASVHVAEIPSDKRSAHEDLYRWLGVADMPRPADVEARCGQLISGRASHRAVAEAIVSYVGRRFGEDAPSAQVDFAKLREIAWLPAEGDRSKGHRPSAVYTAFRKTLFASQASFLDIPVALQRETADFLKWLGVPSEPEPAQVVQHLLWCADHNEPVREDMWIYLNQNAADPALDALQGHNCLLILETNTYVGASDVYWGRHPFGRFRHVLGRKFAEYQALLDRLGVAQHPHPSDAIEVLQDVAARHGGEPAPLLDDDVLVVQACWRLLSEGLVTEEITSDQLSPLRSAEVVLDSRSWLRRPTDVFFRDSVSLAGRFNQGVHEHLIDRPEGLWTALSAAGVRNLSDAVDTRIVEQQPAGPGGIVGTRLAARRRLLLRVLNADDQDAAQKLERFDAETRLQRLAGFAIQQTIKLDGTLHISEPYERGALYLSDDRTLLYVDTDTVPPVWVEIARELVRAFGVDGSHTSSVASAIKGVLGAESDDSAGRELDELGFAALDVATSGEAEPIVATDLGGAAGPEADDRDEPADDHAASTPGGASSGVEGAEVSAEVDEAGAGETNGMDPHATESSGTIGAMGVGPRTGAGESGTGGASSGGAGPPERTQSRLRSYVAPATASGVSCDGDSNDDDAVERAGVDAVLEYERAYGRQPEEMPPMHPGFDIRSVDADGMVRVIEVKATADVWGARGVAISSTQFATAQQRREEFWLYVVDQALTSPRVHPINDPATKVDQYFFDDGWIVVSEQTTEAAQPALPDLRLPGSTDGLRGAVPFRDPEDLIGEAVDAWVECPDPRRRDDWFAVRIEGATLGLAFRGGIAFIEPLDREPEDDELVLVVLHEQTDPDSGRRASLRHWRAELDIAGNRLALRLWSSGSVEPLTVTRPGQLVVHGAVKAILRASEVEDLGYC